MTTEETTSSPTHLHRDWVQTDQGTVLGKAYCGDHFRDGDPRVLVQDDLKDVTCTRCKAEYYGLPRAKVEDKKRHGSGLAD